MIKNYLWRTPNGQKMLIALMELELPHENIWINISKGEQKAPEYLKINPNGRIPAIHDEDTGITMMESGAILQYLAEKTGKLGGHDLKSRYDIAQWLFWQIGGVGPMVGQAMHFKGKLGDGEQYGYDRYITETRRLLSVLETQLEGREYITGEYSIADISTFPWILYAERVEEDILDQFPNVARWKANNLARPATAAAIKIHPS